MIEVSVITPTYNRRAFLPALLHIYQSQTFPKEKMEWIILDDGRDKVEDIFKETSIPNLRYERRDEKMRIGAKRNELNRLARGSIIIAMDDDDYYPPDRIQTVVAAFQKNPTIQLAGSSIMHLYHMNTKKIVETGPYGSNHATNGTMAWRKTYASTHQYDEYVSKAEEQSFLEGYRYPMIQLDPKKTILVMCHGDNTVDKSSIQKKKETSYTLKDWIKDPFLLDFYTSLT